MIILNKQAAKLEQLTMDGRALCLVAEGLAGVSVEVAPAVLVQNGRVAALGEAALAAGAPIRDLSGLWLAPAPLDAHVHLHLGGKPPENLTRTRQAGVAAVRDLGHKPDKDLPAQEPDRPPLVRTSGPGLCASGPAASWLAEPCRDAAEFAAMAALRAGQGAHWIKIFGTGLLDFTSLGAVNHPQAVSREELAAAVRSGREHGLPVAVHGSCRANARAVALAGVRSLEHGFYLEREDLALLAANGVAWVPTIAAVQAHVDDHQGRHDQQTRRRLAEVVRLQREALAIAHELGVELVIGTDAGSYGLPHGLAVFREIDHWLAAGLPPEAVFRAATAAPARLMGLDGELGGIFPGARAWLLATPGDPAADPGLLERAVWRTF